MRRFILSLLILMTFSAAFSQRLYFIYLQTEPGEPFFVKMNEKSHSSSAMGYLILSRLRDSSYTFSVGFPENKWPEQKFTVDLKAKDHGYLLRNFGEKGWGLFDLQTLAVQMALPAATGAIKMEQREVSLFTAILSKAANDPSLRERPVATKADEKSVAVQSAVLKEEIKPVKEEPPVTKKDESSVIKQDQPPIVKKDETSVAKQDQTPIIKKDEPAIVKQDQSSTVKKDETSVVKQDQPPVTIKEEADTKIEETKTVSASEYKRSTVTKRSESSTTEGFGLTFTDEYDGIKDTIRIIIPNSKTSLTEIKELPREERKFLDVDTNETVKKSESQTKTVKIGTSPNKTIAKNNCSSVASENDFLKLRKRMAAERTDDGMIAEAKKYFKTKCFTVLQVKNLSTLFLNDFGKYKFFDAAYTYVSDQDIFSSLSTELKDQYFLYRFKTILR